MLRNAATISKCADVCRARDKGEYRRPDVQQVGNGLPSKAGNNAVSETWR